MISSRASLRMYIRNNYKVACTVYPSKQEALFVHIPIKAVTELDIERFKVIEAVYKGLSGVVFTLDIPSTTITYLPRTYINAITQLQEQNIVAKTTMYRNLAFTDLRKAFPAQTGTEVMNSNGQGYGDWAVLELPLDQHKFFHPASNYIIGDSTAWLCFLNHSKSKTSRVIAKEFNDTLIYALASAYFVAPEDSRQLADTIWEQAYPMQTTLKEEAQRFINEYQEAHGEF